MSLADLCTTTVLLSAYLGIGIFAGALILDMLVTTGLRSRWARATGVVARHGELIRKRIASLESGGEEH